VINSILQNVAGQKLAEFCEHVNEPLISIKISWLFEPTRNLLHEVGVTHDRHYDLTALSLRHIPTATDPSIRMDIQQVPGSKSHFPAGSVLMDSLSVCVMARGFYFIIYSLRFRKQTLIQNTEWHAVSSEPLQVLFGCSCYYNKCVLTDYGIAMWQYVQSRHFWHKQRM
jgi:hypothetical protein